MASLLLVLDLAGVLVFAISGALLAVRRRLDIVGLVALASLTALGGGWIRDVLIGAMPSGWACSASPGRSRHWSTGSVPCLPSRSAS
ncbi:trimeric intracellular cation channel family protein [Kribbella sp. NPDC054772]